MSSYRRNVLVGLTVPTAIAALGWMILKFGASFARPFAGKMIHIKFVMERADGLSDGSAVLFRGVTVGRITKVIRDPDQIHIRADSEVDATPPLPGNLTANIKQTSLLGSGSTMVLVPSDDLGGALADGTTITATYGGLDLIPPEMRQLSTELSKTAQQFREANLIGNVNDRVTQLGKVLDDAHQAIAHINSVIGDEKLKQQIDESIADIHSAAANVKSVTAKADKVADNLDGAVVTINKTAQSTQTQIETISKSAQSRLEEASKLLTQVNEITAKVNEGQGTAGKLVNDPKLYEGLVETTTQLNATIKDLQRLVQQWEQEGVSLKLR